MERTENSSMTIYKIIAPNNEILTNCIDPEMHKGIITKANIFEVCRWWWNLRKLPSGIGYKIIHIPKGSNELRKLKNRV